MLPDMTFCIVIKDNNFIRSIVHRS